MKDVPRTLMFSLKCYIHKDATTGGAPFKSAVSSRQNPQFLPEELKLMIIHTGPMPMQG
jgi:hypothetical protein